MRKQDKNSQQGSGVSFPDQRGPAETKDGGIGDLIDANLRRGLQGTLDEGIPDRFRELLGKLREGAEGRDLK